MQLLPLSPQLRGITCFNRVLIKHQAPALWPFYFFFPPISRAAVRLIPVISVQLKVSLLFYLLFNTARFVAIQVSAVSKLCFLRCFSLLLAVLSCFSYQEQNFKQEQISPNFWELEQGIWELYTFHHSHHSWKEGSVEVSWADSVLNSISVNCQLCPWFCEKK